MDAGKAATSFPISLANFLILICFKPTVHFKYDIISLVLSSIKVTFILTESIIKPRVLTFVDGIN